MAKQRSRWQGFQRQITSKSDRKLKARKEKNNIWFGFGTFGMVGWSVTIPSLLGIALGVWIDTHIRSKYSWTLMCLVIGVALGCFNAWYWINKESQSD
ncbi:MAG: AtpZ/AtpI family protein [Pleurocapsa sp. MO_192.B19]|nr:AtpZ/AtpI family protein [Pleurocapsa sp. MO_192.B19]